MPTKMNEVQAEVYRLLSENEELSSIITGVYDYVPETAKAPYITFGPTSSTSSPTKTDSSEKISVLLYTWSESKGRKETIRILSAVENSMETDISLDDSELLKQKVSIRQTDVESYGLYQGTIEVEFYIEW